MYLNAINPRTFCISVGSILLFAVNAYASDPMGGLGKALVMLFYLLVVQATLLLLWIIIHIWPKVSSQKALIIRTLVDVVVIIYSSLSLGFWFGLPFRYFWGGGLWVPLTEGNYWFYPDRLVLLFLLICFITYFLNKFILSFSRIRRLLVHLFFCILVASSLLTLFEPKIAGPITIFFINPELLFSKYDDPNYLPHYDPNKAGGWWFTKWSEFYGFQNDQIKK